jgi:hypothetical protein
MLASDPERDKVEAQLRAELEEALRVLRVYANPCNWRRARQNGPIDLWESTNPEEWNGPDLAAAILAKHKEKA